MSTQMSAFEFFMGDAFPPEDVRGADLWPKTAEREALLLYPEEALEEMLCGYRAGLSDGAWAAVHPLYASQAGRVRAAMWRLGMGRTQGGRG